MSRNSTHKYSVLVYFKIFCKVGSVEYEKEFSFPFVPKVGDQVALLGGINDFDFWRVVYEPESETFWCYAVWDTCDCNCIPGDDCCVDMDGFTDELIEDGWVIYERESIAENAHCREHEWQFTQEQIKNSIAVSRPLATEE